MIPSRRLSTVLLVLAPLSARAADIAVDLRSRVELFKGTADWQEVHIQKTLPAQATAIIVCDMWDKHCCSGATARVSGLVPNMAGSLDPARKQGIHIIHAPSEPMPFYQDTPRRKV